MADPVVTGYAVRWGDETVIGGEYRERFAVGSLTSSVDGDIRALIGHDRDRVVGRTVAGTLRLTEDSIGLWAAITVDLSTPDGLTLAGTVGRGDVTGWSPSFYVDEEDWDYDGSLPLRTILRAELVEVSVVSWPAYSTPRASLVVPGKSIRTEVPIASRPPGWALKKALFEQKVRGIG